MSIGVLQSWAKQINTEGVNAFSDHKHGLFDTIGIWREAEVVNGSLIVRARLEDPSINPQVKQLISKIDTGMKVGLSIGGDLTGSHTERRGGKSIRVIDEAPLYEISTVGIPANENAEVLGVMYKSYRSPNLYDGYNQYQDPAYSGAYVSGRATDSVLGNNKIMPSEFASPQVNGRDWIPPETKPNGRFLTGGQPDRDKLLQTRTPMQPDAKIPAEPGKSGSSEIFRTDMGKLDEQFFANPNKIYPLQHTDGGTEHGSQAYRDQPIPFTPTSTKDYEPGAKLEEDGHMYLSDGSHSAKCEEWDSMAQKAGLGISPMTKGNVEWFLRTEELLKPQRGIRLKKDAYNWPSVVVFDYNGTLDLRGTGKNIGIDALLALKQAGKTVVIFTSSVDADGKEFMRLQLARHGIIYTDDEDILDQADIFIGDKRSDERRAGKHGVKFINVEDFDLGKILSKSLRKDIYIVNEGQPTETDSLGEGPAETADRIYGDSKHPEMDPTPVRPTRSPTGSPISRDTLKTEEGGKGSQDEHEGQIASGNPAAKVEEQSGIGSELFEDDGNVLGMTAEEAIASFPRKEDHEPEFTKLGTDMRLAPAKKHYAVSRHS